jgi:FkbM family methyltransferase
MVSTQEEHWDYTLDEWNRGEYSRTVVSFLKEKRIKSFIDIGANVGGVSHVLLNEIDSIEKAYLFEPQRDNFLHLFERFKNNSKVSCLNCGIYYGEKYLMGLGQRGGGHVGCFTVVKNENASNLEETGDVFQLFELEFFNLGQIDFVKIDIEGAEWNVMKNSSFLKEVPYIEVELHNDFDFSFFKEFFPQHQIPWYSYYTNEQGEQKINHVFLLKN